MSYTATDLVTSVRLRAKRPPAAADGRLTDDEIIELANEEMINNVIEPLLKSNGNYHVKHVDLTLSNGEATLPSLAVGGVVRAVKWLDSYNVEHALPQLDLTTATNGYYGYGTGNYAFGFILQGNKIRVYAGSQNTPQTVRVYYLWRQSNLTLDTSKYFTIATVSGSVVTVSPTPSFDPSVQTVDIVQADSPSELLLADQTVGLSTNVITFSVDLDDVVPGDYVCLNGYTPVVQLIPEWYLVLVHATTVSVLMLTGDYDAAVKQEGKLQQALQSAIAIVSPRNEGLSPAIVNSYSALRRGFRRFFW